MEAILTCAGILAEGVECFIHLSYIRGREPRMSIKCNTSLLSIIWPCNIFSHGPREGNFQTLLLLFARLRISNRFIIMLNGFSLES